jgi:ATP-dependent DNA helicase RecG
MYVMFDKDIASKERGHVRKRLNLEAVELLRRAIQLSDDIIRTAWCWFDIARTLNWLHSPKTEILNAYGKAMELLPNEPVFKENYEKWKANYNKRKEGS